MLFSGFETLQNAVNYWEDATMKLSFTEDQTKPAIQVNYFITFI